VPLACVTQRLFAANLARITFFIRGMLRSTNTRREMRRGIAVKMGGLG